MLIKIEEYLKRCNVDGMSLEEVIAFKQKLCDGIERSEENRYSDETIDLELHMCPGPSVRYWWACKCLLAICERIIAREDCDARLRAECEKCALEARKKEADGLYGEADFYFIVRNLEAFRNGNPPEKKED